MLDMFGSVVQRDPGAPLIRYFDGALTRRELDELSSAFAAGLADAGSAAGDRVALFLQNVPQFIIAMLGIWKAGGIAVAVNPMNKERELDLILRDCGATALVCLDDLYQDVAAPVSSAAPASSCRSPPRRWNTRPAATSGSWAASSRVSGDGTAGHGRADGALPRRSGRPTRRSAGGRCGVPDLHVRAPPGRPKGAMTTHRNVVFNAQTYRDWIGTRTPAT